MTPVIIESPFGSEDLSVVERNIRYARACIRYALLHRAAPFASHLLYTQPGILCDWIPEERRHGIDAGQILGDLMAETWVFLDLGVSKGMEYGIQRAEAQGRPIRRIHLGDDWEQKYLSPQTRLKSFA